ncbi:tripartite tricarboxylate transporter substrate binding protein [Afifella sp. IM 167]|uniref:Bug family tripartite tricarboxylate transporter substrate binding protein n=1 Tax=Afifella sp. IM 167 TaxID=2033586 RepID=UPI001CCF4200|nr:tripartite tricarboxylate transporter substrate binding protein [Afifella sp. IM 167]
MKPSRTMSAALAAAVISLAGLSAPAQAFPDRPVTIVVPFAAGGGTDITTRTMQQPMAKALGGEIVVKNTAGAGGTIGVAEAGRAKPDGYTLGMAPVGPLTTQPHLRKLPYDVDSFEYVCLAYSAPTSIAVRKDSPFKTLDDLIAYGKENPGKLTFAVQAIGSIPHIAGLALAEEAGIEMTYLPVNGDGPALKALLDGTADIFVPHISFLSSNRDQIKSLAILQGERLEGMPDLATAKEQGFDLDFPIWGGLVAPKGTPAETVAQLDDACHQAIESEPFQAHMNKLGQPVAYMDAKEFGAFVHQRYEQNRQLLKEAGFEPK